MACCETRADSFAARARRARATCILSKINAFLHFPHTSPACYAWRMSLPIHIVLLRPEIPHNTGAIGRLCVGLDCPLHLIRPLGFALTSNWVRRSGMDYWEHLDLHLHDNWDAFLQSVHPARLFFASTRGTRSLYDCHFAPNDALIFGNESSGLPEEFYAQHAADLFQIPMPGPHARSINLANATAVVAYEAFRQLSPSAKAVPTKPAQE